MEEKREKRLTADGQIGQDGKIHWKTPEHFQGESLNPTFSGVCITADATGIKFQRSYMKCRHSLFAQDSGVARHSDRDGRVASETRRWGQADVTFTFKDKLDNRIQGNKQFHFPTYTPISTHFPLHQLKNIRKPTNLFSYIKSHI